ncbi:MAG: hypothetical protein V2A73_21500 [Pseudomonadota bacterium]
MNRSKTGTRVDRRIGSGSASMAIVIAITTAICLGEAARPVLANGETLQAKAKVHFEVGQKLVAEGRFVEAKAEFSAGYELSHRPLFLFNMAECARLSSDKARARELYERYLLEDPQGKLAAMARERLAELGVASGSTGESSQPPKTRVPVVSGPEQQAASAQATPVPAAPAAPTPAMPNAATARGNSAAQAAGAGAGETSRIVASDQPTSSQSKPRIEVAKTAPANAHSSTALAAMPTGQRPPSPARDSEEGSWWKGWPLWATISVAAVAGSAALIYSTSRDDVSCESPACIDIR